MRKECFGGFFGSGYLEGSPRKTKTIAEELY